MTNNKVTHKDNIKGNEEYITSEKLNNKITHKDNITGEKLSNEITHKDNIESNKDQIRKEKEEKIIQKVKDVSSSIVAPFKEYAHNEIEDSKEYIKKEIADGKKHFLSEIQKFNNDDNAYDERWLNLKEFRGSEKEFVLTDKGYELKNNSKTWFYTKDIGLGAARGVVKLTEGVGGLALGTLEKLNLVSDGSVENFANFYQTNIYEKMGDTETLAGGFAEGISQFIIPGVGAYGMFAKLIRAKGVFPFIYRALAAEATTVGIAQVPGDPNFAAFISQMLGVDNTKADNIAKEFWIYLATPDVEYGASYNADDVFAEKLRAIIGDMPMGPVGEALLPLFKMFAKGMRKLRGNNEMINEIEKNIVNADEQVVLPGAGAAINPDSALGIKMRTGLEVGENLEFKKGQGLPKRIKTEADLKKLKIDLEKMATKGEVGKLWYEKSGQKILKMFNNDTVEAEKFVKLIALYSPNSAPKQNTAAALKAWYQFKRGTKIKAGMHKLDLKAHDLLYNNKDFAGYKSNNFYTNLMKVIDPSITQKITTDRWMLRAFGHTTTGNPTKPQLKFIEKTINDIAKKLNWEPEQVQAAIWNTVRSGGDVQKILKTSIDDFATAVDNNLGQISWETAPGKITNHFSEYHTASSIIQNEYHVALSKALTDESGTDIIAKRLGLVTPGQFDALGVYTNKAGKIEFNPSTQTIFVAPKKTGTAQLKVISGFDNKGALTVDATNTINAYAFIKGKLLHQEAVAWHRPTFNVQKGLANGMEVSIKLDKNQFKTLVAALDNEFAEFKGFIVPIGTEDGFRIINNPKETGISIPAFQKRALKVLNNVLDLQPSNINLFNTQTGYIITNGSDTQTIESIAKGSQDLQILIQDILSELQPSVDKVYAKFANKYQWTSQAIEGSNLSKKSIDKSSLSEQDIKVKPLKKEITKSFSLTESWSKKYYTGLTEEQHKANDAWFVKTLSLLKEDGFLKVPNIKKSFNKQGKEIEIIEGSESPKKIMKKSGIDEDAYE